MGNRWTIPLALCWMAMAGPACDGAHPWQELAFEPVQGSAFFNWFGGEISLSFSDGHAGTLWVLMTMDCEDSGTLYPVRRSREPAEQEASVRLLMLDRSLPRFFVGEAGTVELIDPGDGELAVSIHVTLIDEETGAWVTLSGNYPIHSIAMS